MHDGTPKSECMLRIKQTSKKQHLGKKIRCPLLISLGASYLKSNGGCCCRFLLPAFFGASEMLSQSEFDSSAIVDINLQVAQIADISSRES